MREKRVLLWTCVLLFVLAQASGAATLLWKSGFESNTALSSLSGLYGAQFQHWSGTDQSTGYAWPPGMSFIYPDDTGVLCIPEDDTVPTNTYVEGLLTDVTGHLGGSTKALKLNLYGRKTGTFPQTSFHFHYNQEPPDLYFRYWTKWNSNIVSQVRSDPNFWRPTWGMKACNTSVGVCPMDLRIQVRIFQDQSTGDPCWEVQCDSFAELGYSQVKWRYYPIPMTAEELDLLGSGGWVLMESFLHRSHGSDGRFLFRINGRTIVDHYGPNYGNNEGGYDRTTLGGVYGNPSVDPSAQWWDDVEIWEGLPDSAPAAPVANFTGSPTSGVAPLTVNFADTSANTPTSWSWNFGDSGTSTSQNPSHQYTSDGNYTVTLTATNAYGSDGETKTNYITVGGAAPPVADFTASPTSGAAPLTVQFTDTCTNAPTSWSWDFGDSGTSTSQNPSHQYTSAGAYTVTLTATNAYGSDGETKTNYITVTSGGTVYAYPTASEALCGSLVSGTLSDVQTSNDVYLRWTNDASSHYGSNIWTIDTNYSPATVSQLTVELEMKTSRSDTPNVAVYIYKVSTSTWEQIRSPGTWSTTDQWFTWETTNVSDYMTSAGVVKLSPGGCPVNSNSWDLYYDVVRLKLVTSGGGSAPVANFTGTPTSGNAPLTVQFTDTSTNTPTSWSWNFGDSGTSTAQNPSHQYTSAGAYTVTLTATNASGSDGETKTNYITVTVPPPVANFTANPTTGAAPLTVYFTDTSTNSPTSWSWNFGDTGTSTAQSPSHQYTSAGTYTVTLTATNASGSDGETKTNYITVTVPPPVANFTGSPTSGAAPLTVNFTDTSTNSPTSWSWNFGDSGTSTAQSPSHQYASAGAYTVTLTATNAGGSDGETKTDYITVTAPPVANFTGTPTSGTAPLTVNFTDTSTNTPTSWSWNFGDTGASTAQNPSHQYTSAGTYTVSLTATNAGGSDGETKTNYITVTVPPPVANFTGSPTSGTAPLTVNFTDTSTNSPTSWSWNFGDSGTSTAQNPSHQYTAAGTYTVTLTATNASGSDGETKTDYIIVTSGGTIFSDNFESAFSGWVMDPSGSTPDWYTGAPKNGTHSIQLLGASTSGEDEGMNRPVSTVGYSNIQVSFYMGGNSLDSTSEYVEAYWWDGSVWTLLKRIRGGDAENDGQLHYFTYNLPSAANNNPNFKIWFGITASATDDCGYVDDVVVTGGGWTFPANAFWTAPLDTDPGWTKTGSWAYGSPTGASGASGDTPATWLEPSAGHSGANCYAHNLNAAYPNNMAAQYLTTPAINCTGKANVQLGFWRWLGVEQSAYDHAYVYVSNDGTNWTQVYANTTTNLQETAWTQVTYDISAVADNQPTVYLRWQMGSTDYSVVFSGWNIDDVYLTGS